MQRSFSWVNVTMSTFHLLRSDLVFQKAKGRSVRFGSMKVLAKICKHAFQIFALAFRGIFVSTDWRNL